MTSSKKNQPGIDDERTPEEAEQRRDAILKRMLQTKPKQQKDLIKERHKRKPKRSGARRGKDPK